jgi:urocanate hydratase
MYQVAFKVIYRADSDEDAQFLADLMKDRLDNLTPQSTVVVQDGKPVKEFNVPGDQARMG